jgi:hypothetical protein
MHRGAARRAARPAPGIRVVASPWMSSATKKAGALACALVLAAAGTPASAAQAAPSGTGVAGVWTGSARLRSEGPPACEWSGGAEPPAVTLRIVEAGTALRGTLTLDVPQAAGSPCQPLRAHHDIPSVGVSGSSVSFRDASGHEWNLGLRGGDALQGLVAWTPGEPAPPTPSGVAPTRLGGEVTLKRAAAGPSAARPEPAASGGSGLLGVGAIVAANVVGLGAFALVNVLANDDEQTQGQVSCSPRNCLFAGLTDPCLCNANVVSGASCLSSASGAAAGAPCNINSVPCQAGLSCNNGVCEDAGGRCPF